VKIGEILNKVYDEDVGWRPASGTIKPVHIANGLIRALQGVHYDTSGLHSFVVWWRKGKVPDEARSFEALVLNGETDAFSAFVAAPRDFERARRYALGLLGADQGLYPSVDHSSFSLTSGRMATRDNNDRGIGAFAAQLLGDPSDEGSLAAAVMRCTESAHPRDPVTALAWPLLSHEAKSQRSGEPRARSRRLRGAFFAGVRAAAADLATHERAQGNSMRTLQRTVEFVCAMIHAHAQALAVSDDLVGRTPALLSMSSRRRSDLSLASERSLDLIYRGFEHWLGERLAARIAAKTPLVDGEEALPINTLDGQPIRRALQRIEVAAKGYGLPDANTVKDRMQYFNLARNTLGKSDPAKVLGHALVAAYLNEYESGGPRQFLQGLGRRVGLLYPHFSGRARHKRVRPSTPVLDMLVRACIPAGTVVPLEEFLERLWMRFGLILGGRRNDEWDDSEALAKHSVFVDGHLLIANTEQFVDELEAMGLARRYPDHVTFVGDGYES
jgi:hypothetical protein